MDFTKFTVTNSRGISMPFMMEPRKADIMIENLYNNKYNKGILEIIVE